MSEETRAAPAVLVPGSSIAGYVLEEQIGQGGMAVVFRAREEGLDAGLTRAVTTGSVAAGIAGQPPARAASHWLSSNSAGLWITPRVIHRR